jgi:hypothetical protein
MLMHQVRVRLPDLKMQQVTSKVECTKRRATPGRRPGRPGAPAPAEMA